MRGSPIGGDDPRRGFSLGLGLRLDNTQSHGNWIEECTNALGQLCLLAAPLLA